MIHIVHIKEVAQQFLTKRDWWQFHNPKNDAMNMLTESGELAEHFSRSHYMQDPHHRAEIADELSDVWFGSMVYALTTNVDISAEISQATGSNPLSDQQASYADLEQHVLSDPSDFGLQDAQEPRDTVLSLIHQISRLTDLFVWCSGPESVTRAADKNKFVGRQLARIVAHQIFLAHQLGIDLPHAYLDKMERNNLKYPVECSTGDQYTKLKDSRRDSQ